MAVYCPDIPLTFVHIPKTAGSAVSDWLKLHAHGTDYMPLSFGSMHWEFSKVSKHMRARRLNPGTVAVVVRNPWDRLVSTWAYYLRRKKSWVSDDFSEFVMNTSWGNAKRRQTSFFPPNALILRFENLATDFSKIQELCSVALNDTAICNEPLGVKNSSEHKHYTEYYTTETYNEVAKRHAADIATLGYEYDSHP